MGKGRTVRRELTATVAVPLVLAAVLFAVIQGCSAPEREPVAPNAAIGSTVDGNAVAAQNPAGTAVDGSGETAAAAATNPAPVPNAAVPAEAALATAGADDGYLVGGRGPAGGIVFYDNESDTEGWRFLEVADRPIGGDEPLRTMWGPSGSEYPTADFGFGAGYRNSRRFAADFGTGPDTDAYAVSLALSYESNGFDDWFLPVSDELVAAMDVAAMVLPDGLPGTAGEPIWTATPGDWATVGVVMDGFLYDFIAPEQTALVVPIRAFRSDGSPAERGDGAERGSGGGGAGNGTRPAAATSRSERIGTRGPAGGIVVFDKGNAGDGWQFLEVAPGDAVIDGRSQFAWGAEGVMVLPSETLRAVGDGRSNTDRIVGAIGEGASATAGYAAAAARRYNAGGYDDWFLPSMDELELMFEHRTAIGEFAPERYWSSTESGTREAAFADFGDRGRYATYDPFVDKSVELRVRPLRAFAD